MPTRTSLETNLALRARVRELERQLAARDRALEQARASALRAKRAAATPAPRKWSVVKFASRVPRCANESEYEAWAQAAREVPPGPAGFCADCTAEHQDAMRRQGRCENPDLLFVGTRVYKPVT